MSSIRTRVVRYTFNEDNPSFLEGIVITVTEGIVEIEVIKKTGDVYASVSTEADAFVTDAQFLIEECQR